MDYSCAGLSIVGNDYNAAKELTMKLFQFIDMLTPECAKRSHEADWSLLILDSHFDELR